MKTFDVIVTGAGPAGATAAKVLGDAGVSTLLLDKSAFPRDKPCGGGIRAQVTARFPHLETAMREIPVNPVSKLYLESPAGAVLDYRCLEPVYLMIRRCEFDNLLYSLAAKRVETVMPALVRRTRLDADRIVVAADVSGEQQEFACKLVLGCDGANSIIARQSGLRTAAARDEYAIDMMEETPFRELNLSEHDRMYVFWGFAGHFGYRYVFPKCDHINLGLGCKLDSYLSLNAEHYSHQQAFVGGLLDNGLLQGASNRANFRAFPIPISGPLARTYADRVLLAGDAGGFVNAFTAEGIYYAMVSGEHAGRAALQALRSGDFSSAALSGYQRAWKNEIGEDLEKSVWIQRMLRADMKRVDRLVRAASRNPRVADLLARYSTGSMKFAEFRKAMIRSALPLYLRERLARAFSRT